MRELLYRAKAINRDPNRNYRTDYKNGDWVYGLVSKLDDYAAEMTNEGGVSGIDIDRDTICEYTGLLDKNGKKIFEGDILHIDVESESPDEKKRKDRHITKGTVVFENGEFTLHGKGLVLITYYGAKLLCNATSFKKYEVVGNIHDNPELSEAAQ